jgi:hypothetical protein
MFICEKILIPDNRRAWASAWLTHVLIITEHELRLTHVTCFTHVFCGFFWDWIYFDFAYFFISNFHKTASRHIANFGFVIFTCRWIFTYGVIFTLHDVYTRSSVTDLMSNLIFPRPNSHTVEFYFSIIYQMTKVFNDYSRSAYKHKVKKFFSNLNYEVDHFEQFSCISCKNLVKCICYSHWISSYFLLTHIVKNRKNMYA